MSKRDVALHRVLWLVLVILAACSRTGTTRGWGSPHELTIARANDPSSLNPLFAFEQADIDVTQLYAEPLVGLNAKNEPIPLLAERVPTVGNGDVARDGMTLTYHLRHDARFADGVPLTSKDVSFTYHAILDARNPVTESQPYREIERFETPDAYTVVLHFRRPWAGAVGALFAVTDFIFGILPAHAFATTDLTRASWNDRPFGTGPFQVVRWARGDEIVLEPNPYAWRKPHLRRLILKIAPDRNTELLMLRTHAVDVADYLTSDQVVQPDTRRSASLVRTEKNHITYAAFQTRRFPTDDPAVRRAILEAVDTARIARSVFHGLWSTATTEIPPVIWAHDPSVHPYAYDPARAARDLDSAGWRLAGTTRLKSGRPLTVDIAYEGFSEEGRNEATLIQENLAGVGIAATVRGYPSTLFYAAPNGIYYGGRFNLAVAGYYGGSDPEQSEFFTCDRVAPNGPNTTRLCDPAYDRLFVEQSRLTDRGARGRAFDDMQRIVALKTIFVPIVYRGDYSAVNPAVRGWAPNMLFEFSDADQWDVMP